jgi:hypothetical protein
MSCCRLGHRDWQRASDVLRPAVAGAGRGCAIAGVRRSRVIHTLWTHCRQRPPAGTRRPTIPRPARGVVVVQPDINLADQLDRVPGTAGGRTRAARARRPIGALLGAGRSGCASSPARGPVHSPAGSQPAVYRSVHRQADGANGCTPGPRTARTVCTETCRQVPGLPATPHQDRAAQRRERRPRVGAA